jgi:hypothetical protein
MTTFERISEYQRLWCIVLPHLTAPSQQDAARWCIYPTAAVEGAILRAGQRFAPGRIGSGFDPTQAYRYVTAVAKQMTVEGKEKEEKAA